MRASHDLSRVSVSFDEANLVPCAGLLPAAVLAQRIDVSGLVDQRLRLDAHGANSGAKALTVIGSMLAGGDSIDDTGLLRAGALPALFDDTRAPSTIGTWLRAFRWHNVRQFDAVSAVSRPVEIRTSDWRGASRVGSTARHRPSINTSATA